LIASASLWDPNFRRTVVLIAQHDDDGAVGVVLNSVTDATVAEAIPELN
jgi:putative transcriptional regulator